MAVTATMGPVVPGGWVEFRPDNRGFATAVVVSLVFHGVLLVAWHSVHQPVLKPAVAPGPIVARLAAPQKQAAAPAPSTPTDEAPKPRVEEPPAPASPPVAKPKPQPAPVAKPSPVPAPTKAAPAPAAAPSAAASKPSAEPPASASAASAPPSAPATTAKSEPQQASAPAAAPSPGTDADPGTLKQYQLAIITTARKYKRYPRAAMDNNWEGRVEVRMVIGANGMISSMSIKTSTGHELLDKTALDMITKAKPLTPIPAALRGKEFTVDVPVIFSLKEDAPSS
jgi:periplasmic protein TonB